MVEPAAVGRVTDEIASDEDVTDSAIDDGVEENSAAVDDRVEVTYCDVVSVRGDDTLDRVSAGTDDVAAIVDEVAVTDGEDNCSVAALEDGIPTTLVEVTDDRTEETAEVPRENVGNSLEEAEGKLVAYADDTVETELRPLPDGELAVEDEVEPTLEVGTGITTVMEGCVAELGVLLSSEPEGVYVGYVEADGYRGIAAVYDGPSHVEGTALLGV
jgi:hypothetical protein